MELFEQIKVVNLDNIEADAVVTATVDGEKLILTKAKLFARLGRRRREKKVKGKTREN